MDLLAMALVTIAISAERLTSSVNVARVVGAGMLTSGICYFVRAKSEYVAQDEHAELTGG
jgi:hypothetical protein